MKKVYNQPQIEVAGFNCASVICAASAAVGLEDGGNTSTLGGGDVISD